MTMVAAVFRRRLIEMSRYPAELVIEFVLFYVLFLFLFLGARTFGGEAVRTGDTLSAIAIGYIVFMFTQQSFGTLSSQVTQESTVGTLEQLALSRYGLLRVLLVDYIAQTLISLIIVGLVLIPIMATTGRWLHFEFASVSLLLLLIVTGVLGLGLILGGLALVLKRASAIGAFVAFALLGLVAAPVDRYPALKLFPIGHGNFMLRQSLVKSQSAFSNPSELLILIAVSVAYFSVGLALFKIMDGVARERALLGQY